MEKRHAPQLPEATLTSENNGLQRKTKFEKDSNFNAMNCGILLVCLVIHYCTITCLEN